MSFANAAQSVLNWVTGLVRHLALSGLFACLFILPEHLYPLINEGYQAAFNHKVFWGIYLMTFFALASRRLVVVKGLAIFFAMLQLGQFLHFGYFGTLISPHAVVLLFTDMGEIVESLLGLISLVIGPLLIVGPVLFSAHWLSAKTDGYRQRIPLSSSVLVLLLAILPVKAYTSSGSQTFYPNPRHYSIKNTYYAISYFLAKDLPKRMSGVKAKEFLPYQLRELPFNGPMNIVVVMGESLTPSHMSLFGYERDTTPYLKSLSSDSNLVYKDGIAGGVNTKVAVQTFFNMKREPENVNHLFRHEANLFAMAKRRGMTTHYLSAQTANLATYIGDSDIDHFMSKEDIEAEVAVKFDEVLPEKLVGVDLSRSNFIVLHQRGSHSPYWKFHPDSYDKYPEDVDDVHQQRVNSYDNSVLFTDHVNEQIIKVLKQNSSIPTYLFITSDHADLLGEGGKYGHSMLEPLVARVPMIYYTINGDDRMTRTFAALEKPTHYELGEFLAGLMGFEVINPNAEEGVYYINGIDIDGSAGHVRVEKQTGGEVDMVVVRY
ncbi:MAG: phosphoethanolamine transferase [Candidatus Sedimenticola sp. (ex Thyasira tokunagai)]